MLRFILCQTAVVSCLVACSDHEHQSKGALSDHADADKVRTFETSPYAEEEYINDVYIPADLQECFAELDKMLEADFIEQFKSSPEEDTALFHLNLGMSLRNNWGLWRGSRLAEWFRDRGALHPDDMSGIILDSYWRRLNSKPIKLDEQIQYYKDYWDKLHQR